MKKFTTFTTILLAILGLTFAENLSDENFCKDKVLNANYRNPEDCSSFISCNDSGNPQVLNCPEGLHYTENERPWGHCTYPQMANCQDSPIDAPKPVQCGNGPNPPVDFFCDKNDGNFRNPNDCCSYISCSGMKEHIMQCPEGLHWDWTKANGDNNARCEWPHHAECHLDQNPNPDPDPDPTTPNPPYCLGKSCHWSQCCPGAKCSGPWYSRKCKIDKE